MAVLRITRIVIYTLTNWFAIVAGAAALNALVKARHDRDKDVKLAEALAPFPNFTVAININDILTSGGFLAAGEILLAIIGFFSAISLLFPFLMKRTERKSIQGLAIGCWVFGLLWTFGSAVATTDYAVNRDAKVSAYLAGEKVDPATVAQLQKATGLSPNYWIHGYTKFLAIAPWIVIPLTIISLGLTIVAWRNAPYSPSSAAPASRMTGQEGMYPVGQEDVKERDVMKEV